MKRNTLWVLASLAAVAAAPAHAQVKIGGVFVAEHQHQKDVTTDFAPRALDLKLSGDIAEGAEWKIRYDLLTNQVKDAVLVLGVSDKINVSFGQQRMSFGHETMQEIEDRDLHVAQTVVNAFGAPRDLGATVFGSLNETTDYTVGVFNGAALTGEFNNGVYTVAGRLVMRPVFAEGLEIGASTIWGGVEKDNNTKVNRFGADVRYNVFGADVAAEIATEERGDVKGMGYLTTVTYPFNEKLDAVVGYDVFQADRAVEAEAKQYMAGLRYKLIGEKVGVHTQFVRTADAQSFLNLSIKAVF